MATYVWALKSVDGAEIRVTDVFPTKEEAEAWLGAEWESLLSEEADSVSLREDGKTLYDMSLQAG